MGRDRDVMSADGDVRARLTTGALARAGVYEPAQIDTICDLLAQFQAEAVETIRLVFADQHGILRGKTLVLDALPSVFTAGLGMPSTLLLKDTAHKTVFPVWQENASVGDLILQGASDVVAVPDPGAVVKLPWAPYSRLILCDILDRSLDPVPFAARQVLRTAIGALADHGYAATFGLEAEFQIFERVDDRHDHRDATMPPAPVQTRNLTQGWQFLTETRYAQAEPILDRLRRACAVMDLGLRSVEIEMGPSQFEFTFAPSDPMTQADRYVLFRTMVKEICHQEGLHASFMAKPKLPNAAANGWHIHQSLTDLAHGTPAFTPDRPGALTPQAAGWIAGLLAHAPASCLLTTPTVNGYKRYAAYQLAPNRVAWGHDNRGAMIRALLMPGDPAARLENRVADSTANPYFALTSQILSGLDGVTRGLVPPAPSVTPYDDAAAPLPQSLIAAIEAFETSNLYRATLGDGFVDYLAQIKRAEWDRYLMTVSDWEQAEYFNLF